MDNPPYGSIFTYSTGEVRDLSYDKKKYIERSDPSDDPTRDIFRMEEKHGRWTDITRYIQTYDSLQFCPDWNDSKFWAVIPDGSFVFKIEGGENKDFINELIKLTTLQDVSRYVEKVVQDATDNYESTPIYIRLKTGRTLLYNEYIEEKQEAKKRKIEKSIDKITTLPDSQNEESRISETHNGSNGFSSLWENISGIVVLYFAFKWGSKLFSSSSEDEKEKKEKEKERKRRRQYEEEERKRREYEDRLYDEYRRQQDQK